MIARLADPYEDQEQILIGVRDFASRMDFTDLLPPGRLFEPFVVELLATPSIETAVVEHEGKLVAGLGVAYIPFLWNPHTTMADEIFWWAAPDAPKAAAMRVLRFTMDRIRSRARANNAPVLACFRKLTTSPDGVGRVYRALGMRELETAYVRSFLMAGATFLTVASLAMTAFGTVTKMMGEKAEGKAERDRANADAARMKQEADREAAIGKLNASNKRKETEAQQATLRALYAGGGGDPHTGSALLISDNLAREGEYQALLAENNADLTESAKRQQAELRRAEGANAYKAGRTRAGSTLLGGASSMFKTASDAELFG